MLTEFQESILGYLVDCNHNFVDDMDRIKCVARRFDMAKVEAAAHLKLIDGRLDELLSEAQQKWQDQGDAA